MVIYLTNSSEINARTLAAKITCVFFSHVTAGAPKAVERHDVADQAWAVDAILRGEDEEPPVHQVRYQ